MEAPRPQLTWPTDQSRGNNLVFHRFQLRGVDDVRPKENGIARSK